MDIVRNIIRNINIASDLNKFALPIKYGWQSTGFSKWKNVDKNFSTSSLMFSRVD